MRRMPMLACRAPTGGRRSGYCCWGDPLLGAELLLDLRELEAGVLRGVSSRSFHIHIVLDSPREWLGGR